MTTLVVLLLLAVFGWVVWKLLDTEDKNADGKVDQKDVAAAAEEVVAEVKDETKKVVEKVKKARKKSTKKKIG